MFTSKFIPVLTTVFCFLVATLSFGQSDSVYTFFYTKKTEKGKLSYCYSKDGFKWTASPKHINVPTTLGDSVLHTPSILKDSAGIYHLVFGIGIGAKGFGYSTSADLSNWTTPVYIGIMDTVKGIQQVAAPELFRDPIRKRWQILFSASIADKYIETASSTGFGENYRLHSTTTIDFSTYKPANLVFESTIPITDGIMLKFGKYHYLIGTSAITQPYANHQITLSTSIYPTGPYGQPSDPINGKYNANNTTLAKVGKEWFLFLEKTPEGKMGLLKSTDLQSWADFSSQVAFPETVGQGTILKLPMLWVTK